MSRRIRTIKPSILEDEKTATLSHFEFRIFVSLIVLADDHGNLQGRAQYVRTQALGESTTEADLEAVRSALARLDEIGLTLNYRVNGQRYISVCGWKKHQRITNAGKPIVPGPELAQAASRGELNGNEVVANQTRGESFHVQELSPLEKEKEGKGEGPGTALQRVTPGLSASRLSDALAQAGLALEVSPNDRQKWTALARDSPVTDNELAYAVAVAKEHCSGPPAPYVLGVIRRLRMDALKQATNPETRAPPAGPKLSPKGESMRRAIQNFLSTPNGAFDGV